MKIYNGLHDLAVKRWIFVFLIQMNKTFHTSDVIYIKGLVLNNNENYLTLFLENRSYTLMMIRKQLKV